jgi:Protein of unknown function (DUF2973)
MLHLIYIFAFTIIAFLTISNLIRSLISVSMDSQRPYSMGRPDGERSFYGSRGIPHPELLDENGRPINEPLLVMRSVSVEDARQQLDALYKASPGQPTIDSDEEN